MNKNKGISILGILFLGVILIFVLSYFGISIRAIVEDPKTQDNIEYVGGGTKSVWDRYLKDPASYIWNDVIVDIFWVSFISNMERIRDNEPTDYEGASPNIGY